MTGTDTGGLTPRLYNFTASISKKITGAEPAKDVLKTSFVTPLAPTVATYSAVSGVLFGQADVAFGLQK